MPMVELIPNQELEAQEDREADFQADVRERQNQPVITSLAAYVRQCWQAAKDAKQPIEEKMLAALRARRGEYDPKKLSQIQDFGVSQIYMMLTDEKSAAVTSWLSDILFPAGDKPWGIKPTPVPDISQEQEQAIKAEVIGQAQGSLKQELTMMLQNGQITDEDQARQFMLQGMQEQAEELGKTIQQKMERAAKEARDRIETKLHDVVIESGWEEAMHDTIDDIATFPAGVIKGPVLRYQKSLKWPGEGQGEIVGQAQISNEVRIEFNRVSPLDIYPMPNARKAEDGILERHRMTRKYLASLIGVDGYDEDAIRLVLSEYGQGSLGNWLNAGNDTVRQELENRYNEDISPEANIDALQFWGNVQGLKLLEYGMSPNLIDDPLNDYAVEVWLIGNYVIKAQINGDPLGRVPYHFASFRKRNGSIWGAGVPEIIADVQEASNAAARALVNNMGIASGPQVVVDVAQLPPGENITDLHPWKVWPINSEKVIGAAGTRKPVSFFAPPSMASELSSLYQFFSNEADNKTGIPRYSYGSGDVRGGALGTATGLSMMMSNASRGIKNVVRNIDNGIIKPSIERTHEYQLLFFDDPEYLQGDVKVIARGSTALIAKEQAAVRRNELLHIVAGSPAVMEIVGMDGLASILREIFQGADFREQIVPEKQEMQRREQEQQMMMLQQSLQMQGQQPQGQLPLNQQTDPAGNVMGGTDARAF